MAFDDKHDDQTPKPRAMFKKPSFLGSWYQDIEGRDRCPAEWVGPCPYCHRKETRQGRAERAADQAAAVAQGAPVHARASCGGIRPGSSALVSLGDGDLRVTCGECLDWLRATPSADAAEEASLAAHEAAGVEAYQYVSVYGGE